MSIDTRIGATQRRPEVLAPGQGRHHHFLNHLATVKAAAGEDGALSVVEFLAPEGFGPPLHRHRDEDELIIVLDGELTLTVGDEPVTAGSGSTVVLPRAVAHTFQVTSSTARFTAITASIRGGAPRFDAMVAELGVALDEPTLPEPAYIDPTHVADVCAAHGIEILGPPPAPRAATV